MPRIDDILAGVIKGAQEAGAGIERLTIGREEKIANAAGLGGALGSLAGNYAPGIGMTQMGGAIGGAMGADDGHQLAGAAGAVGGGLLGKSVGGALGGALGHPEIGQLLGLLGGSAVGGQALGHGETGLLDKIRGKFSSAEDAYLAGSAEATSRFKIAFLPLLGALAGPALGRMALGRVAGGALGKMGGGAVGRMAGGMAKSKGIGGAAVDMGASMAGQQLMS